VRVDTQAYARVRYLGALADELASAPGDELTHLVLVHDLAGAVRAGGAPASELLRLGPILARHGGPVGRVDTLFELSRLSDEVPPVALPAFRHWLQGWLDPLLKEPDLTQAVRTEGTRLLARGPLFASVARHMGERLLGTPELLASPDAWGLVTTLGDAPSFRSLLARYDREPPGSSLRLGMLGVLVAFRGAPLTAQLLERTLDPKLPPYEALAILRGLSLNDRARDQAWTFVLAHREQLETLAPADTAFLPSLAAGCGAEHAHDLDAFRGAPHLLHFAHAREATCARRARQAAELSTFFADSGAAPAAPVGSGQVVPAAHAP
jgi:hypothetical protein